MSGPAETTTAATAFAFAMETNNHNTTRNKTDNNTPDDDGMSSLQEPLLPPGAVEVQRGKNKIISCSFDNNNVISRYGINTVR